MSAVNPQISDRVRPIVLMVAPVPAGPIVGGIANGVRLLMESRVAAESSIRLFNTFRREDAKRSLGQRLAYQLRTTLQFVGAVLKDRPNIVHVKAASYVNFYQSAIYAFFARIMGRKVILQLHAGDFPAFYDGARPGAQRLIRAALRLPHRLMALSEGWARYFTTLSGVAEVAVIPNALDTAAYASATPDRGGFGIPEDRIAVLFIGTCDRAADEAKGLQALIAAVACLRTDMPETMLVVGGVAAPGESLNVKLGPPGTGWLDVGVVTAEAKASLYRSVDIFALPSRFENMPNTLMEAMAAGLPTVATTVGAIPEMIRDGDTGFLVPVDDVDALVQRLRALVRDAGVRERMGRHALQHAAAEFDLQLLEDRLLAEYRRLIASPPSAAHAVRIQKA